MAEEQVQERQPGDGNEAAASSDLQQQLEEAQKQAAEFKNNWLRTAADLQNYRKRVERDRDQFVEFANAGLIGRLLEVMDGFDAAFAQIPDQFRGEPWVEGIRLVEQKLRKILTDEKVTPMDVVGKQFDPNFHEAMWQEPSPGHPEGEVIGEFQRGYMLGDKVLRPARVKVAKGE